MELIDKSAVVARLGKRLKSLQKEYNELVQYQIWASVKDVEPRVDEIQKIISFIDTLAVKEVDLEDVSMVDRETAREKSILDKTRVEYFATGKPTIAAYSEDNLRNQFDAGADWMKEQIIKALR